MMEWFSETYESAMSIPVPIRKWLLKKKMDEMKKQSKQKSDDEPMTEAEKRRYRKKA